jgi:hypothetical protein
MSSSLNIGLYPQAAPERIKRSGYVRRNSRRIHAQELGYFSVGPSETVNQQHGNALLMRQTVDQSFQSGLDFGFVRLHLRRNHGD